MTTSPCEAQGALGAPLVVLAEGRSKTERRLLGEWCRAEHQDVRVIWTDSQDFASVLADERTSLLPVRVTWLPGKAAEKSLLGDLSSLLCPRKPPSCLQASIARRDPERVRVVVGEPRTVGDMRERHLAEAGKSSAAGLADFVRRSALLACERAERVIIGDRYKVPRMVAEQITAAPAFQAKVTELAGRPGRPRADALSEAAEALAELATVQSPPMIDAYRTVLAPMHASAWKVQVDESKLEQLRELNKRHALVFLPVHRSYVDPLVISAEVIGDVLRFLADVPALQPASA